jgi:integrase
LNANHLQAAAIPVAGHLEEKRGIFQMVLSWKTPDGKRERRGVSTELPIKGNKKRAEKMLSAKRKELSAELTVRYAEQITIAEAGADILFADFMENIWLPSVKPDIKPTTYGGYWINVIKVIAPYFRGTGVTLRNLTPDDVHAFYDAKLKDVKAATVHRYHANIHQAMKYAVKTELISHAIMDRVSRPKKERFVGKFLKQAEVVALFEAVRGDRLELGVILGAFYGLRRSEVVGLKWSAIDFEANTLTIEHTVTVANDEGKSRIIAADTTKSKSSHRTLPLVPQFRARLLELRAEQERCRKLCGNCYDKEEGQYVCVNQLGKLIKPEFLTREFPKFMEAHGFRRMRFHDLRHSAASLLLASGVPLKQIQEWLGHSSFAITADTYAHLEFNSKLQSADAMKWIERTTLGLEQAQGEDTAFFEKSKTANL